MESRIRSLKPHVHFLDRGSERWRVGVVTQIFGGACQVKVLADPGFVRTFSGETADLVAVGASVVEAPIVARLSPSGQLVEVRGSHWAEAPAPGFLARGESPWPVVPFSIRNEPEEHNWTREGQSS